jgi:hypothetical protein
MYIYFKIYVVESGVDLAFVLINRVWLCDSLFAPCYFMTILDP